MNLQACHSTRDGRRSARAFSLAELMIALIILGFGLLVVGAALPVGFTYTQRTVDESAGDAATTCALDTIECAVRLCRDTLDAGGNLREYADIFQPRDATTGAALDSWEPLIKVRPLLPMAVDAKPGSATFGDELPPANQPIFDVEQRIDSWFTDAVPWMVQARREYDSYPAMGGTPWLAPALASVAAVYPPITTDTPYSRSTFFADPYAPRPVSSPGSPVRPGAETLKALQRRIAWTAFYRRVSYASGSDPCLYEIIVVATRLSSDAHRYPRFVPDVEVSPTMRLTSGGTQTAVDYNDGDTLLPVPWLVSFSDPLPVRQPGVDYDPNDLNRTLYDGFVDPPTLRFVAGEDTARLLPPGSIFIPAVNDSAPDSTGGQQLAGFVPHSPDLLPVYKVVERIETAGGNYEIIVENNGLYPWINPTLSGLSAVNWPVWVVPPAFKELDSNGEPVFEDRSPVVAVDRRVIRLPEVP